MAEGPASGNLGGHLVPEGADVVWSPYLHQHDPDVFTDPDAFGPDRWTAGNAAATRGSFRAFGDGRRTCIGENFAWAELQIMLATVLRTRPSFRLTSRTPRLQAVVTVQPDRMTMEFHRQQASARRTNEDPTSIAVVPDPGPDTKPSPSTG